MIAAVDIETRGLDATQYLVGALLLEGRKEPEIYRRKEELWERIKELGIAEAKRERVLNVYAHNARYDFYGYADLYDKHLIYHNDRPFMVSYNLMPEECQEHGIKPRHILRIYETEEECQKEAKKLKKTPHYIKGKWCLKTPDGSRKAIMFLDTMALFKGKLDVVGEMIGLPKLPTPQQLIDGDIAELDDAYLKTYLVRDVEIVLQSVQKLKETLKEAGAQPRRIYTISQVGINLVNQLAQKKGQARHLYIQKGRLHPPKNPEHIHQAYRGGIVDAYKTGRWGGVRGVDVNSLYPYAFTKIDLPDLRTETLIKTPWGGDYCTLDMRLAGIGISNCMVENKTDNYGLLRIRTGTGNHGLRKGQIGIGTWTHQELREAKKSYDIKSIKWSIYWREGENIYADIYRKVYALRKESTGMEKEMYKAILNHSIGKFGQRKGDEELIIDDVEKATQYLRRNYAIIGGHGINYFYRKNTKEEHIQKNYYAPIIPTLINATARVMMIRHYNAFKEGQILYTDTDSIYYIGDLPPEIEIGTELGQFKGIGDGQPHPMIVYGRKTYCYGDEAKIAGFTHGGLTMEQMMEGKVVTKNMATIKKLAGNLPGQFYEVERDLIKQMDQHKKMTEKYSEQAILIDEQCTEEDAQWHLK